MKWALYVLVIISSYACWSGETNSKPTAKKPDSLKLKQMADDRAEVEDFKKKSLTLNSLAEIVLEYEKRMKEKYPAAYKTKFYMTAEAAMANYSKHYLAHCFRYMFPTTKSFMTNLNYIFDIEYQRHGDVFMIEKEADYISDYPEGRYKLEKAEEPSEKIFTIEPDILPDHSAWTYHIDKMLFKDSDSVIDYMNKQPLARYKDGILYNFQVAGDSSKEMFDKTRAWARAHNIQLYSFTFTGMYSGRFYEKYIPLPPEVKLELKPNSSKLLEEEALSRTEVEDFIKNCQTLNSFAEVVLEYEKRMKEKYPSGYKNKIFMTAEASMTKFSKKYLTQCFEFTSSLPIASFVWKFCYICNFKSEQYGDEIVIEKKADSIIEYSDDNSDSSDGRYKLEGVDELPSTIFTINAQISAGDRTCIFVVDGMRIEDFSQVLDYINKQPLERYKEGILYKFDLSSNFQVNNIFDKTRAWAREHNIPYYTTSRKSRYYMSNNFTKYVPLPPDKDRESIPKALK